MTTPIRTPTSSFSSSAFTWGRSSQAKPCLLLARAKALEDEMFYGDGFDPPVNNVIQPNIFNKLDAQCKERTRVINNVLDKRLDVQERCIRRNRDFQHRLYAKQTALVKEDLRKIGKRLPNFAKLYRDTDMALLQKQVKNDPVPMSKFQTTLPEERHYCFRYFEHHNPVRIARRIAEGMKRDLKRLEKSMEAITGQEGSKVTEPHQLSQTEVNTDDVTEAAGHVDTNAPEVVVDTSFLTEIEDDAEVVQRKDRSASVANPQQPSESPTLDVRSKLTSSLSAFI